MLKPLNTKYKGREITLECTHKRLFPPPQMYGSTPDDIDNLWKQGAIDQNQYQHLKTWNDKCGLMVMGPKCLDCPLALKQNPRPGRPNVIETSNWLEDKRKMHWDDMRATKAEQLPQKSGYVKLRDPADRASGPHSVAIVDDPEPAEVLEESVVSDVEAGNPEKGRVEELGPVTAGLGIEEEKPDADASSIEDLFSADEGDAEAEADPEGEEEVEDDIISALADD